MSFLKKQIVLAIAVCMTISCNQKDQYKSRQYKDEISAFCSTKDSIEKEIALEYYYLLYSDSIPYFDTKESFKNPEDSIVPFFKPLVYNAIRTNIEVFTNKELDAISSDVLEDQIFQATAKYLESLNSDRPIKVQFNALILVDD